MAFILPIDFNKNRKEYEGIVAMACRISGNDLIDDVKRLLVADWQIVT